MGFPLHFTELLCLPTVDTPLGVRGIGIERSLSNPLGLARIANTLCQPTASPSGSSGCSWTILVVFGFAHT